MKNGWVDSEAQAAIVPPSQQGTPVTTQSPSEGVGILRSEDGGQTWQLLDSLTNVDGSGNPLPFNSPLRDHTFVGTTGYKIVVDPKAGPNGQPIVYAAIGKGTTASNGGLYRSFDGGNTWQRMDAVMPEADFTRIFEFIETRHDV